MADESLMLDVEKELQQAKTTLEALKNRMMAGEQVDEKELTMLARTVATYIEAVRSRLQEAVESSVGAVLNEKIQAELQSTLSPEEYEEWQANEADRLAFREEFVREKAIREQLAEDRDTDG